jgi:hypothetical protein
MVYLKSVKVNASSEEAMSIANASETIDFIQMDWSKHERLHELLISKLV